MSEPQCYFGVQLDTQCHKLAFCRTTGTVKLTDLEEDIQEILLWRAGLLGHEGKLTICFHRQQLFGNAFGNCLEMREVLNTAVEYLDYVSAGCKLKNKFPF